MRSKIGLASVKGMDSQHSGDTDPARFPKLRKGEFLLPHHKDGKTSKCVRNLNFPQRYARRAGAHLRGGESGRAIGAPSDIVPSGAGECVRLKRQRNTDEPVVVSR